MNKDLDLIDKLYQSVNVMICESKIARTYGTSHKLTYSDICLLKSIQHNEDSKASDLSQFLGITNGAVNQLAKKLMSKGYLESYRTEGNKKEVYYRLTSEGEQACLGYDKNTEISRTNIDHYIAGLDKETIEKIIGLFDVVAENFSVDENCSIKYPAKINKNYEEKIGRCEKCKRIY